MKITPVNQPGDCRTGTLSDYTKEDIVAVLGFEPNCSDDPHKVTYSWGFEVDGVRCGIWDYYKSYELKEWSTFGPKAIFDKLFHKA